MAESYSQFEQIEIPKVFDLLQIAKRRNEKVSLYYNNQDFVAFDIEDVAHRDLILSHPQSQSNIFVLGKIYTTQFEIDGITYSGRTQLVQYQGFLKLKYLEKVNILNRRSDFRMPPPDLEHYSLKLLSIDNMKAPSALTQAHFTFQDLSLGGGRFYTPSKLNLSGLYSGALIQGELLFRTSSLQFQGRLKMVNSKHLSLQFSTLSQDQRNALWNELMNWYRLRRGRYAS